MAIENRLIRLDDLMKFPIRINHYDRVNGDERFVLGIESVLEYAENLPAVDAVPVVHGYWTSTTEPDEQFGEMDYFKCSVCGKLRWFETNYCPNCGADMRERKDNG